MTPIKYIVGDALWPDTEGPAIIPHCCNNCGIWGAGFVLAVSRRWPAPERRYHDAYRLNSSLALGNVQFVKVEPLVTVANIIGQRGVGMVDGLPPIRYDAIREGLTTVGDRALKEGATVHMPRIGCGLAGGDWNVVEAIILEVLSARDVAVFVYDLPEGRAA